MPGLVFPLHYKGGVGKTIVTADTALCCAEHHYQTAAIDFDPQGTMFWTLNPAKPNPDWGFGPEQAAEYTGYMKQAFDGWNNLGVYRFPISDLSGGMGQFERLHGMISEKNPEIIFHDYPPSQKDRVLADIFPVHSHYEWYDVFPLLVTEPTRGQIKTAMELLDLYRREVGRKISANIHPVLVLNKTHFRTPEEASWIYDLRLESGMKVVCLPELERHYLDRERYSIRLDRDFGRKASPTDELVALHDEQTENETDGQLPMADVTGPGISLGTELVGALEQLRQGTETNINVYWGGYWPGIRGIMGMVRDNCRLSVRYDEPEPDLVESGPVELNVSPQDMASFFGTPKGHKT